MGRIKPQALLLQSKKKKGPTRRSISTIITYNLVVILIVLSLIAAYRHLSQRSRNQQGNGLQNLKDVDELKKFDLPGYAVLNTSKGLITVQLYKETSPEIVDKFIELCQKGYFKGMSFHRVIKNYVVQGGDSQGLGAVEDWIMKGKFHGELATRPNHEAFMLGTSKAKGNSKQFDLVITTAPIPDLNDRLNVFGQVIKGEDVVQEIEEVDTDEHYHPKAHTGIITIALKHDI